MYRLHPMTELVTNSCNRLVESIKMTNKPYITPAFLDAKYIWLRTSAEHIILSVEYLRRFRMGDSR